MIKNIEQNINNINDKGETINENKKEEKKE